MKNVPDFKNLDNWNNTKQEQLRSYTYDLIIRNILHLIKTLNIKKNNFDNLLWKDSKVKIIG